MEKWFAENWWVIWGVVGSAAYIAYRVHRRDGDESLPVRLLDTLVPVLDAKSEERRQLTPRAFVLFGVGVLIILAAILFVPGFNR